jgi:large subunit ribosomal protein L21
MENFAVIKTGGKQYIVYPGQKLKIEKLDAKEGGKISFNEVLLVADGAKVEIGTPAVKGAKVEAEVLKQGRNKKVIVFKYHAKTRYRKKKGHRQYFTEVKISEIKA